MTLRPALDGARKLWSGGRRIIGFVLIGLSLYTLCQTYGDRLPEWLPAWMRCVDEEPTTTTTTTPVAGPTTSAPTETATGLIPRDLLAATASSSAGGGDVAMAIDGDPSTAWVCAACGDTGGIGEWIAIAFAAPVDVQGVNLRNGLPEGAQFDSNHRIQRLIISMDDGDWEVTLDDQSGWQPIEFQEPVQTSTVRLEVGSIWHATNADAIGVTEIEFVGTYPVTAAATP